MRQARVLTEPEFKRLLAVVAQTKHAERNRLAFMLSHLAGLRVGEIAGLLVGDVLEAEGAIRERLVVRASIAKGGHERVIFLNDRLRHEIERFRRSVDDSHRGRKASAPLLVTQKRTAFSPNTLFQSLSWLHT
ncbi:site-specific integrase [Pleomorphomonas carboxyditropha]|uniref:Tyr recombinase domain-containing protein n=1 Tax=Pleomorphomonas carboxyditropha TaxID=2023338 RepID=A0A2G9WQR1_9HYPH|nr:site-specific integrase [Pleomorphomonas carboxyditropha]PIO97036.1 hypothetical protein CJ014_22310 [Pleomorphomonas carboxyditropha]